MTDFERALQIHASVLGLSKAEAKEDVEAIIKSYMENDHMTREFAEATFIEETEDMNPEELKRMEENAKKIGALKVGARSVDAYGKTHKRERKPNVTKRSLIQTIAEAVKTCADSLQEVAETEEHAIHFMVGEKEYTVTLTEHRKKKEKTP